MSEARRAVINAALVATVAMQPQEVAPRAELIGFARLPADTFAPGPRSGAHRGPNTQPFASQPVQGFSSLRPIPGRSGWWYALADNGFGAKANSSDFLLRIYTVRPRWAKTAADASGGVEVGAFIQLADPNRRAPFAIVRANTAERWLTGGDFDPESLVLDSDGSFWIGDEFGPFVLHFDARGAMLDPPAGPSGFRSPDHGGGRPNVARSRGFESLAGPVGQRLFAAIESAPEGDDPKTTRILEFDTRQRAFTGRQWTYPFEAAGHMLTELVPVQSRFIAIERDDGAGEKARFKRVFEIELTEPGGETGLAPATVRKRLLVDLLDIRNPSRLGGFGDPFRFPFITPESVWPLDARTLVLVNDNNYPATGGRGDRKDDTEFIMLRMVKS